MKLFSIRKILPYFLILWNIFDSLVHIRADMAEPLRISGNIIVAIVAITVLSGYAKKNSSSLLILTAISIIILNSVHVILNGIGGFPMFIFIGITLLLLLIWSQNIKLKKDI